jgi:hypothetical protein
MIEFGKQLPHKGHVKRVYEWCKKKYGRSKYNGRYPDIVFKKADYYTGDDWGYYDELEQIIFISKDKHKTLDELVHTIIHEYTHYKQNMYHYRILDIYMNCYDNPMEKEADEVADRDLKECLEYLKQFYKDESRWKVDNSVLEEAIEAPLLTEKNIYCQVCSYTVPSIR